jgi:site-specific DNA-methyltransferase (cytosine-N4-specific)
VSWEIRHGDALEQLREMPDESVQCCVTSPPYWRQRDYGGGEKEIGREETPAAFAETLVDVARELRRVLTANGSLWLNLGDKYAAGGNGGGGIARSRKAWQGTAGQRGWRSAPAGYKPKDLTLSPFLVADALRADGWYLRQTIIWDKLVAPEPPRQDRPSTGHEYVFLLTPSFNSKVRDPAEGWWQQSVWSIRQSSDASHIAPMPAELARRCILAGTQEGDTVLDPFVGSGTTCIVAERVGRNSIGIELNPEYVELGRNRIRDDAPLLNTPAETELVGGGSQMTVDDVIADIEAEAAA